MTFTPFRRFPAPARLLAALLAIATLLPHAKAQLLTSRSLEDLKQAAEQGDVQSQLLLGDSLLNGKGTEKDPAQGVQWIRKAAEQGSADAFYILGICYDVGSGVTRDVVQATDWYRKAAENGVVDAQYNLADCYLRGEGVEKNTAEAVKWLERAAEKGDTAAVAQLGFIHLDDKFGMRDPVKAATHLRKAAYNGNSAAAKWALGTLYQSGEGVAQNDTDAVKWFKESAMQGDSTGMYHLALAMLEGRGTPKDELRAAKGNPKAGDFLVSRTVAGPAGRSETAPTVASTTDVGTVEKPAMPVVPKPSFVAAAPAEKEGGFASFVANPPGSEPTARDSSTPPGFTAAPTTPAAPATPTEGDGGFTSFVEAPEKPAAGSTNRAELSESASDLARRAAEAAMARFATERNPQSATGEPGTMAGEARPTSELPSFAREKTEEEPPPAFAKKRPAADPETAAAEPVTETRVIYREGSANAFPVAIAYLTLAMASAMVFISLLFFLTFKTRIRSLEGEIKKAQFELSKANVNLSSMMHQVEQLALKAPEEDEDGPGGFVSLPDWNEIKSQAAADGFKINRSR
jgi:TPR repeat protein